jgi:hypothetical protein
MTQLTRGRFLRAGAVTAAAGATGLAAAGSADAAVGDLLEGRIHDQGGQVYNVKEPLNGGATGAKGDTKMTTGGAITSGMNAFSTTTATFASTDVGKSITVQGAGASGAVLSTTISGFTDSQHVTLAANAGSTVTGANFAFGTDDTVAILNAIAAAEAGQQATLGVGGSTAGPAGTVFFPPGIYMISGAKNSNKQIDLQGHTVNIVGCGGRCLPDVTAAASVLLCTDATAGLLTDSWSFYKGFCVSGNHIATNPVQSTAGCFSTYIDVWATASADVGWTIFDSQNNSYHDCGTTNNKNDGLYMDGGAGGNDFWHFTESGSGRYGIYADTKVLGQYGSFLTNTEDNKFFGGSVSSTASDPQATSKIFLNGALTWYILGMTIRGDNLTGPTVDLKQGTSHWIDLSGCTISAVSSQACILVDGGSGSNAYLFVKTDGVRFLSGANSIYVTNHGAYWYSGIDWAYDGSTNGPQAASDADGTLLESLLTGRTGQWHAATLTAPWTSGSVKFRMRSDGLVELKGYATRVSGSGSNILTLPTGFRPNNGSGATIKPRVAQSTGGTTTNNYVSVTSGGVIQTTITTVGATIHFDGLEFPTD